MTAIIVLSSSSLPLADRIKSAIGGEIHGQSSRIAAADILFDSASSHIGELFGSGVPIVAIMSVGSVVRLLSLHLTSKDSDPPVVCVSSDGSHIVPVLGGHHGANRLAERLASSLDGVAAITTASDSRFGVALDDPPAGWRLGNPDSTKNLVMRLLSGESVRLVEEHCDAFWLRDSSLPLSDSSPLTLLTTPRVHSPIPADTLIYHPACLVLGMGCERNVSPDVAIRLASDILTESGYSPLSLSCITSIDLKADESALHSVADHFGVPIKFFGAPELETYRDRLLNPSERVFEEVGCHGVSEGSALAGCDASGKLVVPKTIRDGVTASLALSGSVIDVSSVGRPRGRLCVVGIGPGSTDWHSSESVRLISGADDIVGYRLYLDLISHFFVHQTRHDFELGEEEARVRHALELAGRGRDVCLVCSGDAGIYAMASLVFELLEGCDTSDNSRRIEVFVSPGISAMNAASSRAGAILGHDFCAISLSDLLTPWDIIESRLESAARGDFVVALYNPVSRRRRDQLLRAKNILLAHRPLTTPVILASNLGREGERVVVTTLDNLTPDDVDMLTIVLVGSTSTRSFVTSDNNWVYTPRGYIR